MSDGTIGVGVIGAGEMGNQHAWNLNRIPQVAIVGIADVDLDAARSLGHRARAADVFVDPLELIADPRVDGVVIASPAATHSALAIHAIAMRKRVLCEKPLALTEGEALHVVEAELAAGKRLLQLGFMREFDPAHMALRRRVVSGEIGRPVFFRARHTMSDVLPMADVGTSLEFMVLESVIHDLHSARFLAGRDISEVLMHSIVEADYTVSARAVSVLLWFGNGSAGHILVGTLGGHYEVAAEVLGESGWANTVDQSATSDELSIIDPDLQDSPWLVRFREAYRREAEAWVNGIGIGKMSGPNTWDGYLANKAATACLESVRIGRSVTLASMPTPMLYRDAS